NLPRQIQLQPDDDSYDPDEYYKLRVSGTNDLCTYTIECWAYRQEGAERTLQSNLKAQLRLDPCIAYWAGGDTIERNTVTINGDVYCNGTLTSSAVLNGDVFAAGFTGISAGQLYPLPSPPDIPFPDLQPSLYTSQYDYVEDWDSPAVGSYFSHDLEVNDCNNPSPNPLKFFAPDSSNPAGVLYWDGPELGDLVIDNVNITGTLVVDGNVFVRGGTTITPVKNFPALVVTGTLNVEASGRLDINGLVQTNAMTVAADAGNITITGALFVETGGMNVVDPRYGGKITITVDPMKSAIITEYNPGPTFRKWSPAGDAFFKYIIRRNPTP
ncbi:MAG: hypothetical protein J7M40_04515, partial [Planctomycetes bacterium]|nr:hypothetical protein [Planctomycetota bacterium]